MPSRPFDWTRDPITVRLIDAPIPEGVLLGMARDILGVPDNMMDVTIAIDPPSAERGVGPGPVVTVTMNFASAVRMWHELRAGGRAADDGPFMRKMAPYITSERT